MGVQIISLPPGPLLEKTVRELIGTHNYVLHDYITPPSRGGWSAPSVRDDPEGNQSFAKHLSRAATGHSYLEIVASARKDHEYYGAFLDTDTSLNSPLGLIMLKRLHARRIIEIAYLIAHPLQTGGGAFLIKFVVNLCITIGYSIELEAGDGTEAFYMSLGFVQLPKLHFGLPKFRLNCPPPPPWYLNPTTGEYTLASLT